MLWTTMDNNGLLWTDKDLRSGFSEYYDMLLLLKLTPKITTF
jgi:hypothetical protein